MRALLALPLLLAACAQQAPFVREGVWRPTGVNDANLAAMAANPSHLARGVEPVTGGDGLRASAAAARWRQGRVTPLPASGLARIEATGPVAAPAQGPSAEALTGAR